MTTIQGCFQTWHIALQSLYCLQGCISCETCSYPELTEDHVLTSAYFKIFRIVTRNAVNKSFWRKKDCSWPPLNKYAMNIWLSSLRIRAHLSWRTGKHLHVLHVLRTYSTCLCPGYQDTTTYAALARTTSYLVITGHEDPPISWGFPPFQDCRPHQPTVVQPFCHEPFRKIKTSWNVIFFLWLEFQNICNKLLERYIG